MPYASIEEAWGGISGSGILKIPNIPRPKNEQSRMQTSTNNPNSSNNRYQTPQPGSLYQCNFLGKPCDQAFQMNRAYDEAQKRVVAGIPPYPPNSPVGPVNQSYMAPYVQGPNYAIAPQYPWYDWAKQSYLNYGANVSNAFYQNPYGYAPQVAQQIANYQNRHQSTIPQGIPTYPPVQMNAVPFNSVSGNYTMGANYPTQESKKKF